MIWQGILLIFLLLLITVVGIVFIYGKMRWNYETIAIRRRLDTAKLAQRPRTFDSKELLSLPAPVHRYFQTALTQGQPMISAVALEQSGTFNINEVRQNWRPFTANQLVITQRAGFDWNASIHMFPGFPTRVHDAYVAGEGILHASVVGAITVANTHGTPEAAQGEFMRFVAEAAWYPTRMLPSQGATWQAVDETSAKISMRDGDTSVTLLVGFGTDKLIESIKAEARTRITAGKMAMAPWQCRFWDYKLIDGMQIPQQGEVEWLMPEGAKPYYRGKVTSLHYDFN